MKTKLSNNFNREEFDCKDGTKVPEEYMSNLCILIIQLEKIRKKIGKPLHINSGYRTKEYNEKIEGAPKSQHLTASAADIRVEGMSVSMLAYNIMIMIKEEIIKEGGVGLYNNFVHYDIRGTKSRWDFRK